MRLWETAGKFGPTAIGVQGFAQAIRTNLLERDEQSLPIIAGAVTVDLKAHGFVGIRLLP